MEHPEPVQRLRVLLVDRNDRRRQEIGAAFEASADGLLTVLGVATPAEAVPTPRPCFDVALLSLGAREDTLARSAELRRALPDVPIVVLGSGTGQDPQALLEAGVQDQVPGVCVRCPNRMRLAPSVRWAVERARLLRRIEVLEEESSFRALHDALTGLPNRRLFCDRLQQALARSQRQREGFAVMFIDLDGFKQVNDSLGHASGDELLVEVARRLERVLRASDTCARWGGDEFALLLPGITCRDDAAEIARKALRALGQSVRIGGRRIHCGASVGISLHPLDGADGDALIRCADMAMYRAKARGGGRYRFFSSRWTLRGT